MTRGCLQTEKKDETHVRHDNRTKAHICFKLALAKFKQKLSESNVRVKNTSFERHTEGYWIERSLVESTICFEDEILQHKSALCQIL